MNDDRTHRAELRSNSSQTCRTGIIVNKGNALVPQCNGKEVPRMATVKHGTNTTITMIGNHIAAAHHGKIHAAAARHGQTLGAIHLQDKNQISRHQRCQFINHEEAEAMIHGWLPHIIIPAFHRIFMEMRDT